MGRSSVGSRLPDKRKASTVSSDSDIEVIYSPTALKNAKVNVNPPPCKQWPSRKKMREVLSVGKSFTFIFALFERIPNTVRFCKLTSSYDAFVNSKKEYLSVL